MPDMLTRRLRQLAAEAPSRPRPTFAERLAKTIGWSQNGTGLRRIDADHIASHIYQATFGQQGALLFFGTNAPELAHPLQSAASLSYHFTIDWGVLTNGFEVAVFNSRWLRDDHWYKVFTVQARVLDTEQDLFHSLTPSKLLVHTIEQIARKRAAPETELLPVDDALVDRLDQWRDETLRHAPNFKDIDERLQQLFAQFFVLRSIEDRALAPAVPSLSSVLKPDHTANKTALRNLFATARDAIQSDLFVSRAFTDIPSFILGGIINDLYYPENLPEENRRYDFSWISSNVLGRAYEKYLATALTPSRILDTQFRLWHQPLRDSHRENIRRLRGAYYTPQPIVQYMSEHCLGHFPIRSDQTRLPRIHDPACGSGAFLVGALDALLTRLKSLDHHRTWGRELITNGIISGADLDQRAVTLSRLSVWLRLAEEIDPLPLPSLNDHIVCRDSLRQPNEPQYDVIIGNPPFLSYGQIANRLELAERFEVARGRFDYSYLFIELALNLVRKDGWVMLIVPNRLLTNRDAGHARQLVTEKAQIELICDFGGEAVFIDADAYIAIISARRTDDPDAASLLRAIRIHDARPQYLT
jgi:type I restriction-modification system DNA methylase subunit